MEEDIEDEIKEEILSLWEQSKLEVIKENEWVYHSDCMDKNTIVTYQDRFFSIVQFKTGNSLDDWSCIDTDVYEVKPVQVTFTEWHPV